MDPIRSHIWDPSPLPVLMDSPSEAWRRTLRHVWLPRGRIGALQGLQYGLSGVVSASRPEPEPLSASTRFEVRTQEETGFHTKAIDLANVLGVAQPAALQISASEAPRSNAQEEATPSRVGSQPERARHTPCLISQGDGIHYPVGHPLLGDGIPLLPASVTDKELV